MKGLTEIERRALVIDISAIGECIPDVIFDGLIKSGRGVWTAEGFTPTARGLLALRICPRCVDGAF